MSRDVFYKIVRARLPAGQIRRVWARATRAKGHLYPDTSLTVPAYVDVNRRVVRGFIECRDGLPLDRDFEPCTELKFIPMGTHKHLLAKPRRP